MQSGMERAWVVILFLVPILLAGCTDPVGHEPATLLQESVTVGDELYRWADADYNRDSTGETRGQAALTVPIGIDVIGLTFQGNFVQAEERWATLSVQDPDGEWIIEREAVPGRSDDHGTITDIWRYRSVHSVTPGDHRLMWSGKGVGLFEFAVHAIPSGETSLNETFDVPKRGIDLELEFALHGWGRAPLVVLVAPDGSTTPLPMDDAHGVQSFTVTPQRGEHRLEIDTTGWGGRLLVRAVQ